MAVPIRAGRRRLPPDSDRQIGMSQLTSSQSIEAGNLHVAYSDNKPAGSMPVLLLHGFPYDVHAYDEVSPFLLAAGCRVVIRYLRGFG